MNTLYPFQKKNLETLIVRRHNLLADEPGLGKTIQAISLINIIESFSVLIICNASIKRNWQDKLEEWLDFSRYIQIIDKKTDVIQPYTEIIIINYDLISHSFMFAQLKRITFDLIICDEAHKLKNMKAQRTKTILAKNGLVHNAYRSLMMTGTPVLNRPVELYPILKVISPQTIKPYSDYYSYAKKFCDAWQDGFCLNATGASNTAELNRRLRETYMLRHMWQEVEKDLPKKTYQVMFIDQTTKAKTELKVLENAERKDFKRVNLGLSAGELAIARKKLAMEKVETCLDMIKEHIDSVGKLVIFAYHHDVIHFLMQKLDKYRPVKLDGSTQQKDRQEVIKQFQTISTTKVFIGQLQAAGEGIDGLQTVCHNVLFLEWSWTPGEIEQALKRVHRIGQTKPVLIRFLVWADSIEEHMMRTALDKVKVIREIVK